MENEELELTPELARQMSDEEIAQYKSGEITVKDVAGKYSKPSTTPAESNEAPETPEEPAEKPATEPPVTTEPQPKTYPEYVPESMRKHYDEKNVDEFAKSVSHFQKLVGEVSQFKPILDYWKYNPEHYKRVVEDLMAEVQGVPKSRQTAQQKEETQEKVDEITQTLNDLKTGNLDEIEALQKIATVFDSKIQNAVEGVRKEFETRDTQTIQKQIQDANTKAINDFTEKVKDVMPMDDNIMLDFLSKVPQMVLPTGGEGRVRYYTDRDLMRAFRDLYGDRWDAYQKQKLVSEIQKGIGPDTNAPVIPSAQTTQHDKTTLGPDRFEKAKTREEAEQIAKSMTDEELQEAKKKRGLRARFKIF